MRRSKYVRCYRDEREWSLHAGVRTLTLSLISTVYITLALAFYQEYMSDLYGKVRAQLV